jgi:hypothetical protein
VPGRILVVATETIAREVIHAPSAHRPRIRGPWQDPHVQRRLLGLLFAVLAAGLGLIAIFSALEGGRAWVIAFTAAALAIWMGGLARRALVRRT